MFPGYTLQTTRIQINLSCLFHLAFLLDTDTVFKILTLWQHKSFIKENVFGVLSAYSVAEMGKFLAI